MPGVSKEVLFDVRNVLSQSGGVLAAEKGRPESRCIMPLTVTKSRRALPAGLNCYAEFAMTEA